MFLHKSLPSKPNCMKAHCSPHQTNTLNPPVSVPLTCITTRKSVGTVWSMDGCTHNLWARYHLIRSFMSLTLPKFRIKPVSRHGLKLPGKINDIRLLLRKYTAFASKRHWFAQHVLSIHYGTAHVESKTNEKQVCIQTGWFITVRQTAGKLGFLNYVLYVVCLNGVYHSFVPPTGNISRSLSLHDDGYVCGRDDNLD